jgi:hypothetical protein
VRVKGTGVGGWRELHKPSDGTKTASVPGIMGPLQTGPGSRGAVVYVAFLQVKGPQNEVLNDGVLNSLWLAARCRLEDDTYFLYSSSGLLMQISPFDHPYCVRNMCLEILVSFIDQIALENRMATLGGGKPERQ